MIFSLSTVRATTQQGQVQMFKHAQAQIQNPLMNKATRKQNTPPTVIFSVFTTYKDKGKARNEKTLKYKNLILSHHK